MKNEELNLKKHYLRCVEDFDDYDNYTICNEIETIPCSTVKVFGEKENEWEWISFSFEFALNFYEFEHGYPDYFEASSCGSTRFRRHVTYNTFKKDVFKEARSWNIGITSVEASDTRKMYSCYAESGEFISEDDCLKMLNKFVTNGD